MEEMFPAWVILVLLLTAELCTQLEEEEEPAARAGELAQCAGTHRTTRRCNIDFPI